MALGWLAAALCSGPAWAADVVVTDLRAALQGAATQVVIEADRPLTFTIFTLSGPDRVVVDLPEVGWRLPARPLPADVGVVERVRYGLFKPGQSRLVLDVKAPVAAVGRLVPGGVGGAPHRLVVDLTPAAVAASAVSSALARAPPAPARPAAEEAVHEVAVTLPFSLPPRRPAQRVRKRAMVIDPGHGGVDPGAISPAGLYEKNITLAVARAVKEALEAGGRYTVTLTRERDVFVALRDRIQIARDANAELFISLHADAHANPRVRGASVYTLSERASDDEAAMLAEKENKVDLLAGIDLSHESREVTNILIDLAQRESMNESSRFAAQLTNELGREFETLRNSHRFAGFVVLKAPDFASVLVELGYLSNRADERLLNSPPGRRQMADAIARAVEGYFAPPEEARRPGR